MSKMTPKSTLEGGGVSVKLTFFSVVIHRRLPSRGVRTPRRRQALERRRFWRGAVGWSARIEGPGFVERLRRRISL